jgi:hypothetical protein
MQHYLTNQNFKKDINEVNYAFAVVCKSVGNPLHLQNENEPVSDEIIFAATNLKEASEICRNYLTTFNLGGGNWAGGQVYHPKIGIIANISFNGKVWKLDNSKYLDDDLEKTWDLFLENQPAY